MDTSAVSVPLPAGERLAGTYQPGARADFAVLWVHGFGSHRGGEKAAAVRAECARRGWAFAAFDFRAHGESPSAMVDLTATRLLEDLAAVRDWLAAQGHTRLGLVGSSMGGFASAWFAKRNPERVVGCVFLAPAFLFLERRWNRLTPEEQIAWVRTGRLRVKNEWLETEIGIGLVDEREQFRPEELLAGGRRRRCCSTGWPTTWCPTPTACSSRGTSRTRRSKCGFSGTATTD